MNPLMLRSIQGVYAAAVTPRRLGTQDINLGVMWEQFDYLVSHGVDGIVLLGSTGEFVHFSNSERMRLMGLAAKRSRVPILINVSHSNLDGCVELAQAAQASGAAGVLLMPPYFFRYGQEAIYAFYRRFVEEAEMTIPVLLYNIPLFTNPLLCDTAERLLRDGVVQGIKDSSGEWESFERLDTLRAETPFTLLIGNDRLFLRARSAGCDGGISGVACAIPELMVALDRAVTGGNTDRAERLRTRVDQFIDQIANLPVPVAIRDAVAVRGLKLGPHAVPVEEGSSPAFRNWFREWLPAVQEECGGA